MNAKTLKVNSLLDKLFLQSTKGDKKLDNTDKNFDTILSKLLGDKNIESKVKQSLDIHKFQHINAKTFINYTHTFNKNIYESKIIERNNVNLEQNNKELQINYKPVKKTTVPKKISIKSWKSRKDIAFFEKQKITLKNFNQIINKSSQKINTNNQIVSLKHNNEKININNNNLLKQTTSNKKINTESLTDSKSTAFSESMKVTFNKPHLKINKQNLNQETHNINWKINTGKIKETNNVDSKINSIKVQNNNTIQKNSTASKVNIKSWNYSKNIIPLKEFKPILSISSQKINTNNQNVSLKHNNEKININNNNLLKQTTSNKKINTESLTDSKSTAFSESMKVTFNKPHLKINKQNLNQETIKNSNEVLHNKSISKNLNRTPSDKKINKKNNFATENQLKTNISNNKDIRPKIKTGSLETFNKELHIQFKTNEINNNSHKRQSTNHSKTSEYISKFSDKENIVKANQQNTNLIQKVKLDEVIEENNNINKVKQETKNVENKTKSNFVHIKNSKQEKNYNLQANRLTLIEKTNSKINLSRANFQPHLDTTPSISSFYLQSKGKNLTKNNNDLKQNLKNPSVFVFKEKISPNIPLDPNKNKNINKAPHKKNYILKRNFSYFKQINSSKDMFENLKKFPAIVEKNSLETKNYKLQMDKGEKEKNSNTDIYTNLDLTTLLANSSIEIKKTESNILSLKNRNIPKLISKASTEKSNLKESFSHLTQQYNFNLKSFTPAYLKDGFIKESNFKQNLKNLKPLWSSLLKEKSSKEFFAGNNNKDVNIRKNSLLESNQSSSINKEIPIDSTITINNTLNTYRIKPVRQTKISKATDKSKDKFIKNEFNLKENPKSEKSLLYETVNRINEAGSMQKTLEKNSFINTGAQASKTENQYDENSNNNTSTYTYNPNTENREYNLNNNTYLTNAKENYSGQNFEHMNTRKIINMKIAFQETILKASLVNNRFNLSITTENKNIFNMKNEIENIVSEAGFKDFKVEFKDKKEKSYKRDSYREINVKV